MRYTPAFVLAFLCMILPAPAAAPQSGKPPRDVPPVGRGKIFVFETFESTEPGKTPKGYQKQGDVAVVEGVAHTGRRSLRMAAATNGPRRITIKGDAIEALGGRHWGRLFFRVQLPATAPSDGVIHSTLVSAKAVSPLANDEIEVRPLDTVMNSKGLYQYIYNVQPRKRPEFARGSSYKYKFTDEWTLAEWFVDHHTQTYRLFINGEEIRDIAFTNGPKQYQGTEIPAVFESYSFGWNNYQKAEPGYVAWIDDIALAKDRIGLRGIRRSRQKR